MGPSLFLEFHEAVLFSFNSTSEYIYNGILQGLKNIFKDIMNSILTRHSLLISFFPLSAENIQKHSKSYLTVELEKEEGGIIVV